MYVTKKPIPVFGSFGSAATPGRTNATAFVMGVQQLLNRYFGAGLVVDGRWGPRTEAAFRSATAGVRR